jgi:hypothetical protein
MNQFITLTLFWTITQTFLLFLAKTQTRSAITARALQKGSGEISSATRNTPLPSRLGPGE